MRLYGGGLGDAEKVQYTQAAGAVTTSAVGAAATAGLIGASAAGPIGLAIFGVVTGLSLLFGRKGPQQKIQSSNDVNQYEPYFQANLASFQAGSISKTDALATFDALWAQLVKDLSNPALGEPGQRAIQERGPNGTPSWGKNWFQLYRDPISNAPDATGGLLPSSPGGIPITEWLIPAGLVFAAMVL